MWTEELNFSFYITEINLHVKKTTCDQCLLCQSVQVWAAPRRLEQNLETGGTTCESTDVPAGVGTPGNCW